VGARSGFAYSICTSDLRCREIQEFRAALERLVSTPEAAAHTVDPVVGSCPIPVVARGRLEGLRRVDGCRSFRHLTRSEGSGSDASLFLIGWRRGRVG
jgi:hypothetical protein